MPLRLYHISEDPDIGVFYPRPSPQPYEAIRGDVVFAVCDDRLHNYLIPRNCPRVTYYAGANTSQGDIRKFFNGSAKYVVAIETAWRSAVKEATLYCYEFPIDDFELLDDNAGYYISYKPTTPIDMKVIRNPLAMLADRGVEVVFVPSLWPLVEDVMASTLCFSLIRMSHAERKVAKSCLLSMNYTSFPLNRVTMISHTGLSLWRRKRRF